MTCPDHAGAWAEILAGCAAPLRITAGDFMDLLRPYSLTFPDRSIEPAGECPRDRIISTFTAATGGTCSVETERVINALVARAAADLHVTT